MSDFHIGTAFALELGIPLKRKPVELRKWQDIPFVAENRTERRALRRPRPLNSSANYRARVQRAQAAFLKRAARRAVKARRAA